MAMFSLVANILVVLLVLISLGLILIILAQRASSNAGLGATLGGGTAESVLGSEAGHFLSRWTMIGIGLVLLISFILYLIFLGTSDSSTQKVLPNAQQVQDAKQAKDSLLFPEQD